MSRARLIGSLATSMVALAGIFASGCGPDVAVPTEPDGGFPLRYQTFQSAGPVTGIWSGVVIDATDLNNASFGRTASEWIGRTVRGTFTIHLATPGVGDRDPDPNVWALGPVPGPGPFIEFVTVTALIDGQPFQTSRADYQTIFFGDVVGIEDTNLHSAFNSQDSFVGAGAAGTGRSVIVFSTFFAPGGVSFDGTVLTIDPSLLQFGHGVIDDLLVDGGTIRRQGTISFRVTTVSLSPLGTLLEDVIQLAALGILQPDQVDGMLNKLDEIAAKLEAGNDRSACNQLAAFINQVQGFINSGLLTSATGQALIDEALLVENGLGC